MDLLHLLNASCTQRWREPLWAKSRFVLRTNVRTNQPTDWGSTWLLKTGMSFMLLKIARLKTTADFEVELIRRLNTVEGKYGQMESELDAICLKIVGIRSELDSLGQVCPRAVAASTPSHPSHSKSVLDTDAPALPVFFRQMCCWDRSRGPFNNRCPSCQSASSIVRRDRRRRGHGSVQCPQVWPKIPNDRCELLFRGSFSGW